MEDQTIWLMPRTVAFTELCDACEEEHPDMLLACTVEGRLPESADRGFVTCARGHRIRVLRTSMTPVGALR